MDTETHWINQSISSYYKERENLFEQAWARVLCICIGNPLTIYPRF